MKKINAIIMLLFGVSNAWPEITSLSGRLYVDPAWTYTKTTDTAVITATFPERIVSREISNGTNANQMTHLMVETGTLTNGESVTYSLLSATNCFGDDIAFSRVNFFAIKAGSNNIGEILLGDAGSDGFIGPLEASDARANIMPGGVTMWYAPDATGFPVLTNRHNVKLEEDFVEPDGLYAAPGLEIDTVDTAFQTTNAVTWAMNFKYWSLAATTNLTFSNADTINVAGASNVMYGVWRIQAATNGTVSTVAPSTNQTYTTATGAVAALPSVSANNIGLGYLVVSTVTASNTFTANTSSLTSTNATFYDATPTTPASVTYELYIGGVAE